jgi:hypothetical protein
MTKQMLNVPFVSRYTAEGARLDCGACCVAMLLEAMAQPAAPAELAAGKSGCYLSPTALIRGAGTGGLTMFKDKDRMFDDLRRLIDDGQPPIVVLKYGAMPDRLEQRCTGRHYVMVVGYDDAAGQVFINDPHYPEAGEDGAGGYRRAYSYETFLAAWAGFGFSVLAPVPAAAPAPPVEDMAALAFSFAAGQDTVWVVAPLGLLVRGQANVPAGPGAPVIPFGQRLTALGAESAPDVNGLTWQQVKTDYGLSGWVAASAGGNRYLAGAAPVAPYTVYVLDTAPVRQAGGISVREGRDINATLKESVPIGGALVVYQRVTEVDGTPWLWVKSPGGAFGWVREKANGVVMVSAAEPTVVVDAQKPAPPSKMERGVHASPIVTPIPNLVQRLQALDIRWYKMLDDGHPVNLETIKALKQAGIEPIVRIYQGGQFPGRLAEPLRQRYGPLRAAGATYVEIGNEPNLKVEWREANSWKNEAQVNSVADNWYLDAKEAIQAGLKPALYAMAPTERNRGVHPDYSSVQWLMRVLQRLAATRGAEVKGWLANEQAWLAVHTADFGRPFDYDPFTGGYDDMCLRGYEIARKLVFEALGVWPVTISTEGGVYSPSHLRDMEWPAPYTDEQWGKRLKDMFDYPTQMRAMCPWTLSDEGVHDTRWIGCGWYDRNGGPRSPVMALRIV